MRIVVVLLITLALSLGAFDFFGFFKKDTVSLALGSGGARGYAHIGVIEELLSRGYKIESIAGSSMGALVGGVYAAGKMEEYKAWVLTLSLADVMEMFSLMPEKGGLIKLDKVFDKLESLVGDVRIEELPIKFTALATNITTGEEVRFTKGRLIDAIRASIAIPSLLAPVETKEGLLVDGGVLNPVPVAPVADDGSDYLVAVDVAAPGPNPYHIEIPAAMQKHQRTILEGLVSLLTSSDSNETKEEGSSVLGVMNMSIETMQRHLTLEAKQNYPVDLWIEIPQSSCKIYEFHRAYEMIEIGRLATQKELKRL